jgi:hypothetical protein
MLRKTIIVCPENSKAELPAQRHGEKRMSHVNRAPNKATDHHGYYWHSKYGKMEDGK